MKFSDMRIGTRFGVGYAAVMVMMVLMSGMGLWRLDLVGQLSNGIAGDGLHRARLVLRWQGGLEVTTSYVLAAVRSANASDRKYFQDLAARRIADNDQLQKEVHALVTDPQGQALFAAFVEQRKTVRAAALAIFKEQDAGNHEAARQLFEQELTPALGAFSAAMSRLVAQQGALVDTAAADSAAYVRSAKRELLTLGCIALAIGVACGISLTRSITVPLKAAVSAINRVAGGNLGTEIPVASRDETGQLLQALRQMSNNLRGIVGAVYEGTNSIATVSSELAAGNHDLSRRTEHQAAALEETTASMNELTAAVTHNVSNARRANELAIAAAGVAQRGGAEVSEVISTMAGINEAARKISDITGVIDGLAFQTNILALNAAVEAARAGDNGRGFAVVASEVRTLAQRSALAAKEIRQLIADSGSKVVTGSALVERAGKTMEEVVASVAGVCGIMAEIMAASSRQDDGIRQINQAIIQMDGATQQNAALVEQAAAIADSLQEQTRRLADAVSAFRLQ